MTLPNFLIAGAPKSGTSSLREYLRSHPDVFMYPREINFFDCYFDKGIKWYEKFFKNCKKEKMIGEKSPTYMYSKNVPERLHQFNPEIKLIFLLRNPVDRAYSAYWYYKKLGRKLDSFEKIVDLARGGSKTNFYTNIIIGRSKYNKYISNFKKWFTDEQIHFIKTNELKNDREQTLFFLEEFLGIKKYIPNNINEVFNVGLPPRSYFLSRICRKFELIKIKKVPLAYIINLLFLLNQRRFFQDVFGKGIYSHRLFKEHIYPPMDNKTKCKLEKVLEDEIELWENLDY